VKVIAAVGRNGSGKDELADYVHRRCGVPILASGDVARKKARERGIEPTRSNLHRLSRQAMAQHGEDFFMQRLIDEIEAHNWPAVAISGVRTPADVETLRARFGQDLCVVHVQVGDPEVRYRRMQARDAPRDPETYQAFLRQEREEEEMFSIGETIRRADVTVENDATLDLFYRQIEKAIIQPVLANEIDCRGVTAQAVEASAG